MAYPARRVTPLDTRVDIETPEHVRFRWEVAGIGPRAVAWAVDFAIRAVVVIGLSIPLGASSAVEGLEGLGSGAFMLALFLLDWAWFTVFESLPGGASPGKRVVGLRVVREDGAPASLREIALRNLLRAADAAPAMYVVGLVAMAIDPRFRRLGDRVAGTIVVVNQRVTARMEVLPLTPARHDESRLLPARLRLSARLRRAIESWLAARPRMGATWADAVARRSVLGLLDRLGLGRVDPSRALELIAQRVREEELAGAALVARRREAWDALRRDLDAVVPLSGDPARAASIVRRYRDACADLGRFRDAPVPTAAVDEVQALCARAHAELYAHPADLELRDVGALGRLVFTQFPADVRREWKLVALSAFLFLAPLVLGFALAYAEPSFAFRVIPAEVRAQMEESYAEVVDRSQSDNAQMAGFYVYNNTGIALRSVAAGIFLGLGTAWVLVYNGLFIGSVGGHLSAMGYGWNLLRFTSGHTAWEIGALIIAGGAGLRLGLAVLDRGGRTLVGSLRAAGPVVARIAAGSALMLAVAAGIEGFWSGWAWPDPVRAAFALGQCALLAAWLAGAFSMARR